MKVPSWIIMLGITAFVFLLKSNIAVSSQSWGTHKVQRVKQDTVIYINPHPDDEVLTFGIPLLNDLREKKKVYVVLMSAGEESKARDLVNGRYDRESRGSFVVVGKPLFCRVHHKYHNPQQENFRPFSRSQFGKERIREFFLALNELGIPTSQLVHYGLPNDHFQYNEVYKIIKKWAERFPNATFKTMSGMDVHPDHAMLGKVVDQLYEQKWIHHKVNYVSIATIFKYPHNVWPRIYLKNKKDRRALLNAIGIYKVWNPKKKEFALGYHSVPAQFDYLMRKRMERIGNW